MRKEWERRMKVYFKILHEIVANKQQEADGHMLFHYVCYVGLAGFYPFVYAGDDLKNRGNGVG